MKPVLIMLDLDNCISDDAWRIPRIDWSADDKFRRYHDYSLLAAFDEFVTPYSVLMRDRWVSFPKHHAFIITTGRSEHYRAITEHWLKGTKLPIERVMMRANGDQRTSLEIKYSHLCHFPTSQIFLAMDDREDIVEMYKDHDIRAHVRAIHNVSAYINPHTQEAHP